jgi:hypothetical protein
MSVIDTTFSDLGEAIYAGDRADVAVTNCTFAGNTGASTIFCRLSTLLTVANSIFKPSSGLDFIMQNGATVTSRGGNLASDAAGGDGTTGPGGFLNGAGDIRNTDPKLLALADNGGATRTRALSTAAGNLSPAINAGNDGYAPHRDQRGFFRNGRSDIGAYESAAGSIGACSITRSGTNMVVGAEVVQGAKYRLQRATSLTPTPINWQAIAGVPDLIATGDDVETIMDPNAVSLGAAFYRIIVP